MSEPVPETVIAPVTVAPSAGLVIVTVGSWVSAAAPKVTVLLVVAWLPELSVALAVSVWLPLA